jgi:hypothetical protein
MARLVRRSALSIVRPTQCVRGHDGLDGRLADAVLWKPFTVGAEVAWTLRDDHFGWLDEMLGTDDVASRLEGWQPQTGGRRIAAT